ncbi:MAG TPA: SDR family oxidoreductase [Anaeromyxobacter sp.]|nr:SDR family oxidoreductase [Anaeromyxobacter sp.]
MTDRAAIVTGAGKGIGEALALKLGTMGIAVCCNSLTDSGAKTAKRIRAAGGKAIFVAGDAAVEETASRVVAETAAAYGGIDILVNNAGIVLPGTAETTSIDDWDRTMAVNVRSVFLLSASALPHLIGRKGVIVNTSSSVALKGVKDRLAYTASKGAVLSMTRAMAADLIGTGVRVNCVCPGTTWTPSLNDRLAKFPDPEAKRIEFVARQPMGRFGTPEEIADGIIYLINATFCTGAVLSIDGGMTMA